MKQSFSRYFKSTITFTVCIVMMLFSAAKTIAQAETKKIDDIIKLSAEKYDFGKFKQSCEPGDAVNASFEITNISGNPVVVDIRSSWPYIKVDTSKETIAPNKSYKLKITFSPCYNIGIFNKGVYITVDGTEGQKGIHFTGEFLK